MTVHSFHLATVPVGTAVRTLARPLAAPGLQHVECMATMRLGAPVVSPKRMQLRRLAVFAAWDDEASIDRFLVSDDRLGTACADGWHVRLEFIRRWGRVAEFADLPALVHESDPDEPVVAVTLARLKLPQVPRFIHWGKPVERLVRDHPGATVALAAMRPPRTVSTFSMWRSTREMTDMVHGHSRVDAANRHATAMVERARKDFHHEFTTLRFRPISEHGTRSTSV